MTPKLLRIQIVTVIKSEKIAILTIISKQNLFHWEPVEKWKKKGENKVKRRIKTAICYAVTVVKTDGQLHTAIFSFFLITGLLHSWFITLLTEPGMIFHALTCLRKSSAHGKFQQTSITLIKCTSEDISDSYRFSTFHFFLEPHAGRKSMWMPLHSHNIGVAFLHLSRDSATVS